MNKTASRRRLGVLLLILILGLVFGWGLLGPHSLLMASDTGQGQTAVQGQAGHGEEGGGHGGPSSEKVWDLVWRALNFAVLFVVLFVVLRKPLAQFLSSRREGIAQTLSDLEAKKNETEKRFQSLAARLSELEIEREKILADYVKEGESEKAKILAHAQEMAERIREQSELTIQQEIKQAKDGLKKEIAAMSASMAEELIKKNINKKDQRRLVEEYLKKVVQN